MKRLFSLALVIFSLTVFSQKKAAAQKTPAAEKGLTWYTDVNEVNKLSLSTGKPVFLFFTGSDWCGWCKKLQNDVFSKKEFVQWANKNVILMEADFPRGKALSPELTKQNNELQNNFGVRGYPTIWMFHLTPGENGQGYTIKDAGSLGYPQGSEPGKEEVKFLADAAAVMEKIKKK